MWLVISFILAWFLIDILICAKLQKKSYESLKEEQLFN